MKRNSYAWFLFSCAAQCGKMQQLEETMATNAVRLSKIGKIAEENPELPYEFIKGALEAKSEMEQGHVSEFNFRLK